MPLRLRLLPLLLLSLVSVSAQTSQLNLSTDLVRLGITTSNMTPNQSALDSGPLLESGVRYAVKNNLSRIIADPGSYYFLSASTGSSGAHAAFSGPTTVPLTIDLQGSDLYMSRLGLIGIFLTGGTNLTLQNFTVDYLQRNYTQAVVTGVNATQRQIQFTVQPGWQNPSTLNALIPTGQSIGYVYVFRNGQPWAGFSRMPAVSPFTDGSVTLTGATATANIAAIRTGDVVVVEARTGGNGILAVGLTSSTLRNIKVYSGGSGVRLLRCTSSLLDHIIVMPRPGTDRLISTVADGIQPQQLGLNNVIRSCRSIRTGDDGFSPLAFVFGSVQSSTGARSVQVQGDPDTALNGNLPLPNGSNVAFERATDGAILTSAVLVSQASAPAVGGLPQIVLTFDRDLPTNLTGTWVYSTDASWRGGNLLLERNAVEEQTSFRGFSIWGIMNGTLYGNYVQRSSATGIDIVHQLRVGDWIVPPVVNLTVINNVIDGTNTAGGENDPLTLGGIQSRATTNTGTPMASGINQNLSLTGNFVANPGRSALWIQNMAGAVLDTNYLFNPNDNPALAVGFGSFSTAAQALQPLVVLNSQNVSLGTNTIDRASRRAFVTDTGFRQLSAYAPGGTLRLSAFNLGTLANASASLTDADGTSWALTIGATSTHAVDVALPSGIGLGGAVVYIKAGNASFVGTLFVDSQDNIPSINQATYQVSASAVVAPATASVLSFLVVTQPGSAYAITATDSFVTPSSGGAGTGVVTVSLAANPGAARTATIEIAGQPVTLTQAGAADPVIATAPQSQTTANGSAAVFTVIANGAQSYQWFLNGAALAGQTASTLTVNGVTTANAGTYTVAAKGATGSTTSSGALLTISNLPVVSRLSNLSILTTITDADPLFTVGTVIGGAGTAGSKGLLVRAGGPALAVFGVGGTLADPTLAVFSGQTVTASNDNWGGTSALNRAFAAVGAFGYPSADSKDAASYNPAMPAGGYTIQVSGVGGATGTVIAELYDSTPASQFTPLTPRLVNVSVLKKINAGEILTAGFVIAGSTSKQVLIRAIGPTLGLDPFNIGGVMGDPKLDLFSGQTVINSNDNWGGTAALVAANSAVGAFAPSSLTSKDAILLANLAPGPYTVQVSGVGGAGGLTLIEVYEVP